MGPLEYAQGIRMDCNFRENLFQNPIAGKLIDEYHLGEYTIQTMTIEEIFAEKIQALSSRKAPRDLYDIWYLLKNNVSLDKVLVEKKFEYYHEKIDKRKIEQNINEMREKWERDLENLLKKLPDFDEIASQVKKELSL